MSNFRPGTLDVNETVLGGRIQRVTLTQPNQFINIGNTKILQLTSDSATASDRPFSFTRGDYPGHELTIQCLGPGTNKVQLQTISAAYIKIGSVWTGDIYSQLQLTWNGFDWIESGRSSGGTPPAPDSGFVSVQVSSAEINNMTTTPVVLVPGVVGKIIVMESFMINRPGVTPFSGGSAGANINFGIQNNGAGNKWQFSFGQTDLTYAFRSSSGPIALGGPVRFNSTLSPEEPYHMGTYAASQPLVMAGSSLATPLTGGEEVTVEVRYHMYDS